MADEDKTKEQLFNELMELRRRVAELEKLEIKRKRTEEALREAEARYRSIFENAVEGIFQTSVEGCILTANSALARMLGYGSPDELMSEVTNVQQIYIDPSCREELIRLMQTKENGIVTGFENHVRRKDGSKIWVSENVRALRDSRGRLIGFEGMVVDITERRRAEEALRESEIRFRSVTQSATDAIISIDSTGNIISWNKGAQTIFGCTEEEAVGRPLIILMPERYRDAHLRGLERVNSTGETRIIGKTVELVGLRKEGSEFPLELSLSTWKIGERRFYTGIIRDITERKRAEQELRESEERYRSTLDSMLEGCQIIGFDWRYLYVNDAVSAHGRKAKEELLGRTMMEVYPGIENTTMFAALQRCMDKRIPQRMENEFIFPDGSRGWFELSIQPLPDGVFVLSLDITERKRALETLKNYTAKLEGANRLKDLFTDIMRHDLLNPLGVIKTAAEQMLVAEKDERMCNTLLMVKRNADKLIDMIKSASMYAMLESAEKLERSKLDLNEIFREVVNNFKSQLEEKNMKLEYISRGGCCVLANPMIDAVFSNLISNAIKYSPAGKKIEVNIIEEKEHFKIYVKDWGYGIKDDDKLKIFTRFQRVEKRGVKGTGLGLAIAKRVVDLHGGKIWIEDNPEGGSVFCVVIPKA